MRSSYTEVGVDGSPIRLPLWLRRFLAWLTSFHPLQLALTFFLLHRTFALFGKNDRNPVVRDWCSFAGRLTFAQSREIAEAIFHLDRFPIFRDGARTHARNCCESMFLRSGWLDVFFASAPIEPTATADDNQRPYYLVPGLPARRYWDKEQFPWARTLEESYPVIRRELDALLQSGQGFGNYQTEFNTTIKGWNTYSLWLYGERHEENAARCPETARLLESLPGFETGEWILFSALNPNSRILPHVGPMNGVLRGHLAMIVPEGCGLRVGGQETGWQEGKVLVFDDSFVHEVWNHSDQIRVVLFLNFWHPSLGPGEREALGRLRKAYHDTPTGKAWHDRQERPLPATLAARK